MQNKFYKISQKLNGDMVKILTYNPVEKVLSTTHLYPEYDPRFKFMSEENLRLYKEEPNKTVAKEYDKKVGNIPGTTYCNESINPINEELALKTIEEKGDCEIAKKMTLNAVKDNIKLIKKLLIDEYSYTQEAINNKDEYINALHYLLVKKIKCLYEKAETGFYLSGTLGDDPEAIYPYHLYTKIKDDKKAEEYMLGECGTKPKYAGKSLQYPGLVYYSGELLPCY